MQNILAADSHGLEQKKISVFIREDLRLFLVDSRPLTLS